MAFGIIQSQSITNVGRGCGAEKASLALRRLKFLFAFWTLLTAYVACWLVDRSVQWQFKIKYSYQHKNSSTFYIC